MKKFVALLLTVLMLLNAAAYAEPAYKAGIYTATQRGRNADIVVEVTFTDDSIADIKVISHDETPGIGDMPIERIPAQIIANQSLAVDAVASATITSDALLAAIADCVAQAGGDVEALKAKTIEKVAGEKVVMNADVIVIGGGGSGLAAATVASEAGAKVIVVEKTAGLGGNTKLALGLMNAADPVRQSALPMSDALVADVRKYIALEPTCDEMAAWQAKVSEQLDAHLTSGSTSLFDSPEFHALQTYVDGSYCGNPALIETMCANALDSVEWLASKGLKWPDTTKMGQGVLWQRAHQATEYKSGLAYVETFTKTFAAESLPVEIVYEVRANELISDENGRVIGVKGEGTDGTPYEFYGEKGVVLATGGFGANVEMRQEYNSIWANLGPEVPTSNSPAMTGDGILMAQGVGANLVGMDKIQLLPVADPETGETNTRVGNGNSPYINQEGKRFVAEDERRDVMAAAILEQTGSCCWLISTKGNNELDENNLNAYGLSLDYLLESGKVYMADTLEELAAQINMDPAALTETIAKFNEAVDKGYDEEFGRTLFAPNSKIEEGPFYACRRAPAVHHTMGGVEIDSDARVYNTDGAVIPGLYACGEVTGGIHGANRVGGNAITDAITFGRIAGQSVVEGE